MLPFFIKNFLLCFFMLLLHAGRHVGEPAWGVRARPGDEAQVGGRRARSVAARDREERRDASVRASRA